MLLKLHSAFLTFVSTYLCDYGFLTMLLTKTTFRNRLELENDIRQRGPTCGPRTDILRPTSFLNIDCCVYVTLGNFN